MLTGPLVELNSETFIAVKAHHSVGAPLSRYEPIHQGRGDHPPVWCEIGFGVAAGLKPQLPIENGRRMALCAGLRLPAAAAGRLGVLAIITSAGGRARTSGLPPSRSTNLRIPAARTWRG